LNLQSSLFDLLWGYWGGKIEIGFGLFSKGKYFAAGSSASSQF